MTTQKMLLVLRHMSAHAVADDLLLELDALINISRYYHDENYEHSGHFIITRNKQKRNQHICHCCGVITHDIRMSDGTKLHFGFDYGH